MLIGQTQVTGIVLSCSPVGDYDRRLVIMTKELGKITAFARGARRPNSSLIAATQPFVFGKFEMYMSKKYINLRDVQVVNFFSELRSDFEKVSYGLYFLELVDYYIKEQQSDINVLKLLYQSLRALMSKSIPDELVKCIFELKLISYNGEIAYLNNCIGCGNEEEMVGFSFAKGGMVCSNCINGDASAMRLKKSTIYTIQYIVYSKIEKLYTFTLKEDIIKELTLFMKYYFEINVEKKFKTLEMLSVM